MLDRARRSPTSAVIGHRGASERAGEIVHAGICIQTSPRVCVPINYTARPMSRYPPTGPLRMYARVCMRACVTCARVRRRGSYLSRVTSIIIHTSARRTHIPGGAPTGGANLSYHGPRPANEHDLSLRCRGPTTSYRRPISLTRNTRARERSCHTPLIIARTCDIKGDRYALSRTRRMEVPNRRRFLLISHGRCCHR